MASRSKDSDLVALALRAERAKLEGDPSSFLRGSFASSEFAIVLGGCIDFSSEVPEFEKRRMIIEVALDSSLKGPITAESLLTQCSRLERDYLSLPKKSFRLLTEISLSSIIDAPRTKIGKTTLTFNPKSEAGFAERSKLFQQARHTVGVDLPNGYMRLSACVSARSPSEAAERALNDIDLVRASWNLALNRSKSWRSSSGRPAPVNDVRLSPFHTLHEMGGQLASHSWWYDPGYSKPATLFSDKPRFQRLLTFATNLRLRLTQSPYRADIESALIRYVRALDSADLNDAFLRLWSLLEYLTDSGHDPYKVAARRAAFMFADRERSLLVLTHLTNHRNRFVHAGSDTNEIESLVYLLKRYVDSLLLFHLGSRFPFATRADAARFMDSPSKREEIDLRLKRLRYARKFLSGASGG